MPEPTPTITNEDELAGWLKDKANDGRMVRTELRTNDRVIARVTDGIYRQPSSAFRELISNAWDADATKVTILTDAPRFSKVYVRDDGRGISDETMARLLHNIGGSAKRSAEGRTLGITDAVDLDRSPAGRQLIGKIGIGLFSVSQLATHFRVVTKVKGADHRLVAEVRLRTYHEQTDSADGGDPEDDGDSVFTNAAVYLIREDTEDLDAHGTDIILDDLKPRVRDLLRDADRWREVDVRDQAIAKGDVDTVATMRVQAPEFHTGYIAGLKAHSSDPALLSRAAHLPWTALDPPGSRMAKLVDAVAGQFSFKDRPSLSSTLDSYLEMIWTLGLSVPVPYVEEHPFDLKQNGELRLFWLSNEPRGRATELILAGQDTVRDAVRKQVPGSPLLHGGSDPVGGFSVLIDDVELRRPVRFRHQKTGVRGIDTALMFVGQYNPDLKRIGTDRRGGNLALEGYLFWNGRVVPKENNGLLIRIREASGALFDETFLKYQISEQTRLRQITSELFITQGMDAALNIDRESFNYAHPHVQLVTIWLHRALRQLTNRHKEESGKALAGRKAEEAEAAQDIVLQDAEKVWRAKQGTDPSPDVMVASDQTEAEKIRGQGAFALMRTAVPTLSATRSSIERIEWEGKAAALVKVLSAYGVFDDRTYAEQNEIIEALLQIFFKRSPRE